MCLFAPNLGIITTIRLVFYALGAVGSSQLWRPSSIGHRRAQLIWLFRGLQHVEHVGCAPDARLVWPWPLLIKLQLTAKRSKATVALVCCLWALGGPRGCLRRRCRRRLASIGGQMEFRSGPEYQDVRHAETLAWSPMKPHLWVPFESRRVDLLWPRRLEKKRQLERRRCRRLRRVHNFDYT